MSGYWIRHNSAYSVYVECDHGYFAFRLGALYVAFDRLGRKAKTKP